MALVSVMSAKGAPGTTTTALLLANLWPAPTLVVDADPLGGDIALRLPGEQGALDAQTGLMSLLPSARRGLEPHAVLIHAQAALGGQGVIAGLPGPEQASAVGPLWGTLAHAFARVPGHDVFADVGQAHTGSPHLAMLEGSSAVLCVFRPTAASAVHTRRRLESLEQLLQGRQVRTGIVCVAAHREMADAEVAAAEIRNGAPWVHDYGVIAHDRATAVIYHGGEVFRPERSLLARSGGAVARQLYSDLGAMVAAAETEQDAHGTPSAGRRGKRQRGRRSPAGSKRLPTAEEAS